MGTLAPALAALSLVGAIGPLMMVRWEWPFTPLLVSVNLAAGHWAYVDGRPNYVTTALYMVSVSCRNSRDVRGAFGLVPLETAACPLSEIELLRRFEPVLRFTYGELFLPCDIRGYIERCALHRTLPDGTTEENGGHGGLCRDRLGRNRAGGVEWHFLRSIERILEGRELARWLTRENRPVLKAVSHASASASGRWTRCSSWCSLLGRKRSAATPSGRRLRRSARTSAAPINPRRRPRSRKAV